MASRQNGKRADANGDRTSKGHTRDVVVARIVEMTVYRRGKTYYLYDRENGQTKRPRVDGDLAVARTMAAKVVAALSEKQRTPYCFQGTSPSGRSALIAWRRSVMVQPSLALTRASVAKSWSQHRRRVLADFGQASQCASRCYPQCGNAPKGKRSLLVKTSL